VIIHLLAASGSGGSSLITLLVFALPLGLLFVFMRNQQKRVKQQQSNQQAAQVGEDILTTSGIFGTIVDEDEDEGTVTVEIAPGTQIRMVRAGIARRITEDDYEDDDGYADDDDQAGQPDDEPDENAQGPIRT
jgi:preprotein translocase subunit YajC